MFEGNTSPFLFMVDEIKELPAENGFRKYEKTGKAAAICACGFTTGLQQKPTVMDKVGAHICPLLKQNSYYAVDAARTLKEKKVTE